MLILIHVISLALRVSAALPPVQHPELQQGHWQYVCLGAKVSDTLQHFHHPIWEGVIAEVIHRLEDGCIQISSPIQSGLDEVSLLLVIVLVDLPPRGSREGGLSAQPVVGVFEGISNEVAVVNYDLMGSVSFYTRVPDGDVALLVADEEGQVSIVVPQMGDAVRLGSGRNIFVFILVVVVRVSGANT
ncbi:hypothetical protein PG985_014005 [Apiospora marii]|uniref:uncharacterized protein n=1 Tax=Apiospora marii TaxID=335849 RepID=UPI0031309790